MDRSTLNAVLFVVIMANIITGISTKNHYKNCGKSETFSELLHKDASGSVKDFAGKIVNIMIYPGLQYGKKKACEGK